MKIEIRNTQSFGLQEISQVPRHKNGRIKWMELKDDPVKLAAVVETLAKRVVWQGNKLTWETIQSVADPSLQRGLHHYPGGIHKVREVLNLQGRKEYGYWTKERTEEEARRFQEENGKLTEQSLRDAGLDGLIGAIAKHGGMTRIKKELNIKLTKRPNGAWNKKNIEEEARAFVEAGNKLTIQSLGNQNRWDLIGAIMEHYPGKFTALQKYLGMPTIKRNYWTVDRILEEVKPLIRNGKLDPSELDKIKGLKPAIKLKYPGSIHQLYTDLGLEGMRRQPGYWTLEAMEEKAREFFDQYGTLSQRELNVHGLSGLSNRISTKYPGGLPALREKLSGICESKKGSISKDQANTALESLFEEGKND